MSRLLIALVGVLVIAACASNPKPLPAHLDPSNPEAAESPPSAPSTTLASPTPIEPGGVTSAERDLASADAGPSQVYACPMHPEVRSAKPDACPKCGMKLVLEKLKEAPTSGPSVGSRAASKPAAKAAASQVVYSCPMHPEVQSGQPGKCPKCGMKLEKKAPVDAGEGAQHQHHGGAH